MDVNLHSGESTIFIFITSDTDFVQQLRRVKARGGPTVLIHAASADSRQLDALCLAATESHMWTDVLKPAIAKAAAVPHNALGKPGGKPSEKDRRRRRDAASKPPSAAHASLEAGAAADVSGDGEAGRRHTTSAAEVEPTAVADPNDASRTRGEVAKGEASAEVGGASSRLSERGSAVSVNAAARKGSAWSKDADLTARYSGVCEFWHPAGWGRILVDGGKGKLFVHNTALRIPPDDRGRRSLSRCENTSGEQQYCPFVLICFTSPRTGMPE